MAKSNLSHAAETLLARQHHRLELLQNRIADASPQKLLKRGYSITLKDGKAVKSAACLQPGDELMMKVALSTTSVDGAKKNLEAEIPAWDFEGVKTVAHNEWNNYLSRIEIDGTDDEKQISTLVSIMH